MKAKVVFLVRHAMTVNLLGSTARLVAQIRSLFGPIASWESMSFIEYQLYMLEPGALVTAWWGGDEDAD